MEAHTLQRTYTDSVLRAGGVPVLLAPVPNVDVSAVLDRVDGVVLSGGGDIEPSRYDSKVLDSMYGMDFDRDEFEIELARQVAERRTPMLAICRGLQVLNVALGGTLIEDIPTQVGSMDHSVIGNHVFNGHQHVRLEADCRVAAVVGSVHVEVNSIHHQAVRDLAAGFRAVGWADDGVIEAISTTTRIGRCWPCSGIPSTSGRQMMPPRWRCFAPWSTPRPPDAPSVRRYGLGRNEQYLAARRSRVERSVRLGCLGEPPPMADADVELARSSGVEYRPRLGLQRSPRGDVVEERRPGHVERTVACQQSEIHRWNRSA